MDKSLKEVELDQIYETIRWSKQHDLEAEVILSSINYIKNNPKASIKESLEYALTEWDL